RGPQLPPSDLVQQAKNSRQEHRKIFIVSDHEQRDDEDPNKGKNWPYHALKRKLRYRACGEQADTGGRMRHGESDIGFDENSKMNRLDAERDGDGGQNWDENNQRRQRVHEHPDQEKQDLNQQKEQI